MVCSYMALLFLHMVDTGGLLLYDPLFLCVGDTIGLLLYHPLFLYGGTLMDCSCMTLCSYMC